MQPWKTFHIVKDLRVLICHEKVGGVTLFWKKPPGEGVMVYATASRGDSLERNCFDPSLDEGKFNRWLESMGFNLKRFREGTREYWDGTFEFPDYTAEEVEAMGATHLVRKK